MADNFTLKEFKLHSVSRRNSRLIKTSLEFLVPLLSLLFNKFIKEGLGLMVLKLSKLYQFTKKVNRNSIYILKTTKISFEREGSLLAGE